MAYNLSKIKAPRMTGWALKIFTSILEKTFPGKIIINKLLKDSGIPFLTGKRISEEPAYYPLHGNPKDIENDRRDAINRVSTAKYLKSKYKMKQKDSFRYPGIDDYASLYRKKKLLLLK